MKKYFLFGICYLIFFMFFVFSINRITFKKFYSLYNCEIDRVCLAKNIMDEFSVGMTRDEVFETIYSIDQGYKIVEGLQYNCYIKDKCSEYVYFFPNILGQSLKFRFVYSYDNLLIEFGPSFS